MKELKFNSAEEMLETIQTGIDLYNINSEQYVFVYNEEGSVCVYTIERGQACELELKAREKKEYWGAFLGIGGYIYDDPSHDLYEYGDMTNLDWCEVNYDYDGWYKTEDIIDVLQ